MVAFLQHGKYDPVCPSKVALQHQVILFGVQHRFQVAERTYILSDGSVVLCCKDWAGYTVLGNVNEESLQSIWNSAEYRRLRNDISNGKIADCEVCRRCVADNL